MEYHQITLNEWQQWKEEIRQKLKEAAGNFVYIGYRLRQIRDSGMYDGAADVFEFAQKEYGLSKSTVSRFIAIQEKFSDPDEPLLLKKEYEAIGSSKLSEMLTLPDSECEMITEHSTVKDIRALKEFDREAKNVINAKSEEVSDSEKTTEQEDSKEETTPEIKQNQQKSKLDDLSPFEACIYDFFSDPKLKEGFNALIKSQTDEETKAAVDLINPSGARTHKKGQCFMSLLDYDRGVRYKLMTEPKPCILTWDEFFDAVADVVSHITTKEEEDMAGGDYWTLIYGKNAINTKAEADFSEKKETEKKEPQKPSETKENQEKPVATSQQELPFPDGVEPEITHVSPDDPLPEEPEEADKHFEGEVIEDPKRSVYEKLEDAALSLLDTIRRKNWIAAKEYIKDIEWRIEHIQEDDGNEES